MPEFDAGIYPYLEAQSKNIDFNNGTITQAKMTVDYTGSGTLNLYLSADGGGNWESVTSGAVYVFTNTGTDLRWKIGASGNIAITRIQITNYH